MAKFQAPESGYAGRLGLVVAKHLGVEISISACTDGVESAILEDGDVKVEGIDAICKHLCSKAGDAGAALYPAGDAAVQDKWLNLACKIAEAATAWVAPTDVSADDAARNAGRAKIQAALKQVESGGCPEPGTLGNLALTAALQPLFMHVMGPLERALYPATSAAVGATLISEAFVTVTGGVADLKKEEGWASQSGVGQAPGKDVDPEKAKKAAAKKAEKEAKKAKAAAKAAAKAEQSKKKDDWAGEKKRKEKEEKARKRAEEEAADAALVEKAKSTPVGEKKDTQMSMPKGYLPKFVEAAWYEWWDKCGFFAPDLKSDKPPFVIVIPPPNVTGALHIGHALTNSIEDTIVRWRRMSGYNALWVPGMDHAGIATQTVVEKMLLREEGITRHDLGREKFLGKVWEWKSDYGGRILQQLKRLGSSVDWTREAFTMDDNLSRAVQEAFIRFHKDGLIYRDNRLVNWCCKLRTAVSDIEVDYVEIPGPTMMSVPSYDAKVEFGVLTKFAYQLEDGSGEVVIATTRPETMLGDTAVAVHPEDPRYKAIHGKFLVHPVLGRKMPIVCDAELVDMSFGTGAVKITPAHDPNDFNTGKRHNLESINVLTDDGFMNANCGPFAGQKRFECREKIIEFMKEKGLYRGREDNPMSIPVCSRSKDVIEPVLKPQWWVDCKDMAAEAVRAVREGELEIVPADFTATWYRWLENIRDWCISRQLWWGHRIPAFYVQVEGEDHGNPGSPSEEMDNWVIATSQEEALEKARERYPGKNVSVVQDEDVLDTWFSSGLFPFSVFQWPNQTEDLAKFYPTSLLETGHDILFFWVARMVMMGMKLTGKVPFKQVYLHSMVRDAHGRKMSKSLGNVIDPIHVIEGISLEDLHKTLLTGNLDEKEIERAKAGQKQDFPEGIGECGTDALRFALVAYTSQARDINLDIKRVQAYRNWCNKLWNALKFAMMNIGPNFVPQETFNPKEMPFMCRWVLHCLNQAIDTTVSSMESYLFSGATDALYGFWQYKLCDNFIEMSKPVMNGDDETAKNHVRQTLWVCLETGLRLLHPFMPFVTEELWQRLPKTASQTAPSIMVADYPRPDAAWEDTQAEADMALLQAVVTRVRSLRADYDLTTKARPEVYVRCADADRRGRLAGMATEAATLSFSSNVWVGDTDTVAPKGCAVTVVDNVTTAHVLLVGLLDPKQEVKRLEKKREAAEGRIAALEKRMGESTYLSNTPEEVKEKDAETLKTQKGELEHMLEAIEAMKALALEDGSGNA